MIQSREKLVTDERTNGQTQVKSYKLNS